MLGLEGEFGICMFPVCKAFWGFDDPILGALTIVIPGCVDAPEAILACMSCSCNDWPVMRACCPGCCT